MGIISIHSMKIHEAGSCEKILRSLPEWFGIEEAILNYRNTRCFYQAQGFLPLEENFLWGKANPCLMMIKYLPKDI